ncbi:MAG: tRNA (cytidine(56)-2'-O)-methyltransferase [Candidatus Diapherotrites archaeon]
MPTKEKNITVLRYGHRPYRDLRVTTHCCLVARAFGAEKILIQGDEDASLKKTIDSITKNWGGTFQVEFCEGWLEQIKKFKREGYYIVHLTMYGKPLNREITKIRRKKRLLVIIGSKKVEIGVYRQSDINISVGKQPHSEIAALAVFLDRLFDGKELEKKFPGAKIILTAKNEKK